MQIWSMLIGGRFPKTIENVGLKRLGSRVRSVVYVSSGHDVDPTYPRPPFVRPSVRLVFRIFSLAPKEKFRTPTPDQKELQDTSFSVLRLSHFYFFLSLSLSLSLSPSVPPIARSVPESFARQTSLSLSLSPHGQMAPTTAPTAPPATEGRRGTWGTNPPSQGGSPTSGRQGSTRKVRGGGGWGGGPGGWGRIERRRLHGLTARPVGYTLLIVWSKVVQSLAHWRNIRRGSCG